MQKFKIWAPKWLFSSIAILTLTSQVSWARDLEGRVGIGYNAEFSNSYSNGIRIPALSVKYGLSRDLALEGILGLATTNPSNSVTACKLYRNLFFETNLNFYFMGGVGLIDSSGNAGIELLTGVGVEFFIPGLESLGFAVDTGVSFDNSTGSYALKTLGVSFLDAGIHFYF